MIWAGSGGVICGNVLRLVMASTRSIFIGQHDGQHPPRDGGVRGILAPKLQIAVVIIEFPEHPFLAAFMTAFAAWIEVNAA
jgi:hypothetical protein